MLIYYLLVVIFIITDFYHVPSRFILSVARVLEGCKGVSVTHNIALI